MKQISTSANKVLQKNSVFGHLSRSVYDRDLGHERVTCNYVKTAQNNIGKI